MASQLSEPDFDDFLFREGQFSQVETRKKLDLLMYLAVREATAGDLVIYEALLMDKILHQVMLWFISLQDFVCRVCPSTAELARGGKTSTCQWMSFHKWAGHWLDAVGSTLRTSGSSLSFGT